MEPYLIITHLNDFIFCPRSIFFHQLYGQYSTKTYHRTPQTAGLIAHKTLDTQTYSRRKDDVTGLRVYSEQYRLCGAIDLYRRSEKHLIERKRQIKVIYPGYRYQLYAQYYCLLEMEYEVQELSFHSLVDNKRYPIPLPGKVEKKEFETHLAVLRSYSLEDVYQAELTKCAQCIYSHLCDYSLAD